MEPSNRFVPQNRAQRRRLIKAYKGFKPKGRDAAHTMNRHMKIKAAMQKADADVLNAAKQGVDNDNEAK
jgi:hypothetical protein